MLKKLTITTILCTIFSITFSICNLIYSKINKSWVSENGKWYCYQDKKKLTGWVHYKGNWYYCNSKGERQTGWIFEDGNWYYLYYEDGHMATDTIVYGYYVNSTGAWTTSIPNSTVSQNNNKESTIIQVPVTVTNVSIIEDNIKNHTFCVAITVKNNEYNVEKTFYQYGGNMSQDAYAYKAYTSQIKLNTVIYAEMRITKENDEVKERSLFQLIE